MNNSRKNLIVVDEEGNTIGRFPRIEYGACALTVATFGYQVHFNGKIVWQNDLDGDASESYDNFSMIVRSRILGAKVI